MKVVNYSLAHLFWVEGRLQGHTDGIAEVSDAKHYERQPLTFREVSHRHSYRFVYSTVAFVILAVLANYLLQSSAKLFCVWKLLTVDDVTIFGFCKTVQFYSWPFVNKLNGVLKIDRVFRIFKKLLYYIEIIYEFTSLRAYEHYQRIKLQYFLQTSLSNFRHRRHKLFPSYTFA
jgi:hypothetical protein